MSRKRNFLLIFFSLDKGLSCVILHPLLRGALGFSVLRIWPIFDSVFRFSFLKIADFRFWCLVRFAGFLQFNLWFSVFVKNDGGFSDSSAQFILRFF